MKLYDELVARGLIAQVTNEEAIREMIDNGKATFYIGFDRTADSLHVGHFMALCLMKRLQMAGNKPIALIGGGTGDDRRPLGPHRHAPDAHRGDHCSTTAECFKKPDGAIHRLLRGQGDHAAATAAWLLPLNYIELLREVGACFSVNNMLRAECYKQRMEKGLSFLEFNYMIMQSYDFYYMFQHYGCNMEFGGNDQWSNMLGGTRAHPPQAGQGRPRHDHHAAAQLRGQEDGQDSQGRSLARPEQDNAFRLLSSTGATSAMPTCMKCLRMLTFLPLEEINAMEGWEGSQLNKAKEILAYELTKLVHGEEEANKARDAARALFLSGANDADMPTTELTESQLTDGRIGILDLMLACKLAPTKSEARRLVQQGGVFADDEKVASIDVVFTGEQLKNGVKLRKGKKVFHKAVLAC